MMGKCFLCGRYAPLEQHHIFGGAYRKKSEKLNLKVGICHNCHNEPPVGVHHNAEGMLMLKQYGQREAMKAQEWTTQDFIREFGKNYL